jgi:hypothetical protein
MSPDRLHDLLTALAVERGALARIERAAAAIAEAGHADVVKRIYINLERRTPPGRFHPFGARLMPAFNYFQTGASLYEVGLLDASGLPEIAGELFEHSGYTLERLRNSLEDLVRRGHLRAETRMRVLHILERAGIGAAQPRYRRWRERLRIAFARWREQRARRRAAGALAAEPLAIDYDQILREWSRRGLRGA